MSLKNFLLVTITRTGLKSRKLFDNRLRQMHLTDLGKCFWDQSTRTLNLNLNISQMPMQMLRDKLRFSHPLHNFCIGFGMPRHMIMCEPPVSSVLAQII